MCIMRFAKYVKTDEFLSPEKIFFLDFLLIPLLIFLPFPFSVFLLPFFFPLRYRIDSSNSVKKKQLLEYF